MASREIQMRKLSEGSTGTGGRVDELPLPVDISHGSRSQQADANDSKDLELNLQKENVGASSGGSSEDDEHPVSESRSEAAEVEGQGRVTLLEPIREEEQDDVVAGRTHEPVVDAENTDHTETEEESAELICRTCGPDEEILEEPDNLLVKLGCHCRGSLSRMHRKCILEWYGRRICQENNYKCEVCNALLHGRVERIVFRALIGRDSGTDILINALGMRAPRQQRARRPRRNALLEEPARVQAHNDNGNAHPDFHQVNIVETTYHGPRHGSTLRPQQFIGHLDEANRQEHRVYQGSAHSGYPVCVVFFVILVLIGLGIGGVGKSH